MAGPVAVGGNGTVNELVVGSLIPPITSWPLMFLTALTPAGPGMDFTNSALLIQRFMMNSNW